MSKELQEFDENYVSYKISKRLYEIGFFCASIKYYEYESDDQSLQLPDHDYVAIEAWNYSGMAKLPFPSSYYKDGVFHAVKPICAPIYAQVFDWLRDKHGLFIQFSIINNHYKSSKGKYYYLIWDLNNDEVLNWMAIKRYHKYIPASESVFEDEPSIEIDALVYCLDIVEKRKKDLADN